MYAWFCGVMLKAPGPASRTAARTVWRRSQVTSWILDPPAIWTVQCLLQKSGAHLICCTPN